ncbi:MAG: adenylate kinase [Bacteroidetes bacterium]|nr:adenylate kinase [Bacteroidota bacterium]
MKTLFGDLRRVSVIGTSGSGKSTFARRLAAMMHAPHIELDQLYWGPEWTEPTDDVFFPKIETALSGDSWVIDGNYTRTQPIKWARVQLVIWLDFPLWLTLYRVTTRALSRILTQRELWPGTGNRETWAKLFGKDSIVRWSYDTHASNIVKYERTIADPRYAHITFIRLCSPREAEWFLRDWSAHS